MTGRWHLTSLTASALLPFAVASAFAGPNGANVIGGAATIQGQGTANVTVNQSTQNAIINWQTFNIGSSETTKIYMPNSSSTELDRVTGGQGPSQILGTLSSNGKVFLVNPDGILFGMGARINVGSLVATTNDIANSDFMAGRYNFTIPGNPNASIVNMGTITAQSAGFAALVAPGVRNTGTITARLGTIALASGNAFTLDMYGDNLITLGLSDRVASQVIDITTGKPLKSLVDNAGKLKADGGTVVLTAVGARKIVDSVINNSGVIEANTIGSHNGMIVLGGPTRTSKYARGKPTVTVSGTLSAAGKAPGTSGGTIKITGDNIQITAATINASGQAGGGTVLIGGDWGGGHPNTSLASGNTSAVLQQYAVPNANTVSIDAATMIDASAAGSGNGGKVIVWANQATTFLGTILAEGGTHSGNGGFVETSGGTLTFSGSVNTTASNGKTGTWLLDPADLTVDSATAAEIVSALAENNVILATTAEGASGYGNQSAGQGDINIDAAISWSGSSVLTLSAYHDININNSISGANGGLTLIANNTISATAGVTVGSFALQNGAWTQVASILPVFSANNFVITGGSFLRASGGDGSVGAPYQIADVYGLQGIGSSAALLSSYYLLANNIDASGTTNWNGGAGFVPIGNSTTPFTGTFDGNGNTISHLTINLPSSSYVGLFGELASSGLVERVGVVGGSVTGDFEVGGLVGGIFGTVTNSYATDSVTGNSVVGGLVGGSSGTISQSYAAGAVSGSGGSSFIGGLVGANGGGTVIQSYAIGAVTSGDGSSSVGGLIGGNPGTVTSSYWDTQTTGQTASAGGTPLNTVQLQSGLPSGFDATFWSRNDSINNGFPYLLWQLPAGSQVIAGYVFNDAGLTSAGGGISVLGLVDGTSVGTATTGANGSYNIVVLNGTISGSGSQVLTYTAGDHAGAAYIQNATGSVENLNIYLGYLNETSGAATLSAISSGLSTAIGGNANVQSLVNSLANRAINATGQTLDIDQSISAATLLLTGAGTVTQSAPIAVSNLALSGSGNFTLTNPGNQIGNLAANVGGADLSDSISLSIASVGNVSGVTASNAFTLDVSGNIEVTGAVNVGTFTLVGGGWSQIDASLPAFNAQDFVISGGSFLRASGGNGSTGSPYQITDVYGLQGIGSSATLLAASYILANNVDASGTANWNGGAGFVPIGNNGNNSFAGIFNGDGNAISNVTIKLPSEISVGLFGSVDTNGVVENVSLTGTNVSGREFVGALIGTNAGAVSGSSASGTVNGSTDVGGLIGYNAGTIINTNAAVDVTGSGKFTGGLIGYNVGTVATASASGTVTAREGGIAGGLVGANDYTLSQTVLTGSILNSAATGAVTTGDYGIAGGLVGSNSATISQSNASGVVIVGANSIAGGLVGINSSCCSINGSYLAGASISTSHATGAVSSAGVNVELGGLVGENDPLSVISNSQANGAVTSTANVPINDNNCSSTGTCLFVNVGGFVGTNYGTISGTAWTSVPTNCSTGGVSTCSGGNVAVGQLGEGGGFVGLNQGTISYAFATGSITGAAGLPDTVAGNVFDNTTEIAGFVAENQGLISHSLASGDVGTAGTGWLSAAGFVGSNQGTIDSSLASGVVTVGDSSTGGGFASSNSPGSSVQNCTSCITGDGFNNNAVISNSQAFGSVTAGSSSLVGGFAAIGGDNHGQTGGDFANISASGAVNAGHDSIVGGLVGVLSEGGTIDNSTALNIIVASSGANSIVGGIAGVNEGTIFDATSTATVSGTTDSYIGGITGINLGLVSGSSADPAIGASGGGNFIGGIAGLNAGSISNSNSQAALIGGSSNYVGGLAGVNADYGNSPGTIPNSSYPIATITNSSTVGSGFTQQVGSFSPSFIPGLPAWLTGCTDPACTFLTAGSLQLGTTPSNMIALNNIFADQQVMQFTQQSNFTTANIAPPLVDPTSLYSPGGGAPGNGVTGSVGGTGSLANGRQGGNGAPPGVRLIDMPVMPLPPGTGLPPPGETRFLQNQIVLQFGVGMTPQQIAAIAQRLGLTLLAQQAVGVFGRTVYIFQIANGRSVADVIRAVDNTGLNVAAQPNYTYGLTQDQGGSAPDRGDPAQYVVSKLQLGAVHRITQGTDVVVALIDSQVDIKQPDIAGRIVDNYDTGCGPNTPPDAHGTGMAGAIASHVGLLGVAPNAKILAICAFGGTGQPEATSARIVRGVDYAIAHGAKIINMSFAGPRDPALAQEIQIAREKGILIVAAAGNAGAKSPPLYPGADPNVIAVTATDEHDHLFNGANQGPYVAVAAPGVNILVPAPNGDVQFTTGTSVASANVSGVAALLMAEKQIHTPEEIRAILVDTARHLGTRGMNPQFGAGLVDPLKALRFVPASVERSSTAAPRLQLH